jgi:hypothetical protein
MEPDLGHLGWFVFNGLLSFWCWRISKVSFSQNQPGWGWANIFASAVNAAAALLNLYNFLSPPAIIN